MQLQWPAVHSEVYRSPRGEMYLKKPGVVLIAQTAFNAEQVQGFLDGFEDSLGFKQYLADPGELAASEHLTKLAGQLCYLSFGSLRSWNKDAAGYFRNIKTSGHGSVLEHASFSFLCYGIDRSVTHELVRHRAGFGFSQVSQRYVDGRVLRFVERAEYQNDTDLHLDFIDWIEQSAARYNSRAERLLLLQHGEAAGIMSAETKRDARKKVNQAARSCLPNETEAPIIVTANVRGWRHFCEMRASGHADVAIRSLGMRIFECLRQVAPLLFDDYAVVRLLDGTDEVTTSSRKV